MSRYHPIPLISDSRFLAHDTGGNDHPESPARLTTILARLTGLPLAEAVTIVPPRMAERQWLETCHTADYLFRFEEAALSGRTWLDHPDNQIGFDSYEVALFSAGAGLTAIDLLESQPGCLPFCCVRPPGHHAETALALGFCFLNNSAIAARYWQQRHGRQRIAIIDWDAHHGNGIQAAFESDPEVLYISLHEHPTFSFPGTGFAEETGLGPGRGATLNLPLRPGADDETVLRLLAERATPALEAFRPEALIVAAGFDGHRQDDMSGLSYSTALYGELGRAMAAYAKKLCAGRVVTILEGGYHLASLADSVAAYLHGLAMKPEE